MGDPSKPSFPELMTLSPEGDDVYVGTSPEYPSSRIYGGLVVSQALRAALHTVPAEHAAHSLHAYFMLEGYAEEPIRYEVTRIREGRSFMTRRVEARQSHGVILEMTASFHRHEEQVDVQLATMPQELPVPESGIHEAWNAFLLNYIQPKPKDRLGYSAAWIRMADCPPDDPILQTCAIAYQSDEMPMVAAMFAHPKCHDLEDTISESNLMGVSLDHAVWFHRPGAAHDWIFHETDCPGLHGARGQTETRLFGRDGTHVATVSQEVLLREPRKKG